MHGLSVTVSLEWTQENEGVCIKKIYVKTGEEQEEEVLENMWEYLTENYCSEVLIE